MNNNLNFVQKLRISGLRPTKQRIKICEILFGCKDTFHFSINDLSKIISQKTNEQRSCPLPATKEVCLGYSVIHDIGFVDITKISLIKENSLCSSPTQEKYKL